MSRLTAQKRYFLIRKVLDENKSVAEACREFGVSRYTFYKWLKVYRKIEGQPQVEFFKDRYIRGKVHWQALSRKKEKAVLELVTARPQWGSQRIASYLSRNGLKISNHGVQNILQKNYLGRRMLRQAYQNKQGIELHLPHQFSPAQRLKMIEEVKRGKEKVTTVCRRLGISRYTFYKWYKRYFEKPEDWFKNLNNRYLCGENHPRFLGREKEGWVLDCVVQHPEYSCRKITNVIPQISYHGIQNILVRHNLNTYQKRLTYQQSLRAISTPVTVPTPAPEVSGPLRLWRLLKAPFATVPKIPNSTRSLLLTFFFTFVSSFILYRWALLLSQVPLSSQIGLLLATVSLTFGFFFFLYSLKYYFTLILILGFSRQVSGPSPPAGGSGQEGIRNGSGKGILQRLFGMNGDGNGIRTHLPGVSPAEQGSLHLEGENGNGNGGNGSLWQRIFGFANGSRHLPGVPQAQHHLEGGISSHGGLQPDLSHVILERTPFVSIHLPMYNEKRVVDRLLTACTSMEYENPAGYEVVVVDDSTDETTAIVQEFAEEWNGKQPNQDSLRGSTSPEVEPPKEKNENPRPYLKLIHRTSREGFKGGALKVALANTDPRAEFVIVFDADFLPYPDTITQFLKYFQVTAGSLDVGIRNQGEKHPAGVPPSVAEALAGRQAPHHLRGGEGNFSPIAAIQGYQWHVLNKSENWITRGVRSEYAGSYVIERSGEEALGALKQIAGSVYMIRKDILDHYGWGTSITEDFELTLKLYRDGYKVVYTPYIQTPSECVSTLKRLIRQRMRWAEGHSHNIKKMFSQLMWGRWEAFEKSPKRCDLFEVFDRGRTSLFSQRGSSSRSEVEPPKESSKVWIPSQLTLMEKLEFLYLSPYYLQAAFFMVGTLAWFLSEAIFKVRLPFWTSLWGWSLVFTNLFSLPLMNTVGLFLEESEERDYMGTLSFIILTYLIVPFQGYAALKGFIAKEEGPWFRTPKTGKVTDVFVRGKFFRWFTGIIDWKSSVGKIAMTKFASGTALSPYLSLATAHNVFNNFSISPKRARWIGKTFLIFLLLASIITTSFGTPLSNSRITPELSLVQILNSGKANAQEFGMILPSESPTPTNGSEPAPTVVPSVTPTVTLTTETDGVSIPTPTPTEPPSPTVTPEATPTPQESPAIMPTTSPVPTSVPTTTPTPANTPPTSSASKLTMRDGTDVNFNYTDDNSNESLIIKTNAPNYLDLNRADVYFAVSNIDINQEYLSLQFHFPNEKGDVAKIEKWITGIPYEIEVPEYGTKTLVCEEGWSDNIDEETGAKTDGYFCQTTEEMTGCDSLSEDKKTCFLNNQQLTSHKETRYKDDWQIQSFDGTVTEKTSSVQKDVPQDFQVKKTSSNISLINSGETQFFRIQINFPINSSGEFYIEAIGDKDGYGLLDPWWDSSWLYKKPVSVTYSGSSVSNYQVRVSLDTKSLVDASKLQSDCDDIRFVNANEGAGDGLDYWIESGCNSTATVMWVEIPSLSGNTTIFMYYGNSGAAAGSNGDNTFDFFDDFPGSAIDTNKWQEWNPNSWGSISVGSSILTINAPLTGGSGNMYVHGVMSLNTFTFSDYIMTTYSKWACNSLNAYLENCKVDFFRIADQALPTSLYAGNQFVWYFQYFRGIISNIYELMHRKSINGTKTELDKVTYSYPTPANYQWMKNSYYTGPNERLASSTDGVTYTNRLSDTDSVFTLPTTKYFGISLANAASTESHTFWVDWVNIRKYVSTEPTTAAGAETTLYPTAYSFQRKTFYDATNGYYWRFSYDGSEIDIEYNTQPWTSSWTAITSLAVNTADFSLWDNDTYVYIAYAKDFDIIVRQGTLGVATITWGSAYTALDGTGEANYYEYAFITRDTSGYLWAMGRFYNGTNYYIRTRYSSAADNPSSWNATYYDLSSTSGTSANTYGVMSPLATQNMYAVWITGTAIEGSKYTGTWSAAASIATGKSGLDSNISVSSDTSNNLHLAYIDGSNYVQYKKYNGTAWDTDPTRIDTNGSMTYVTVSVDTTSNDIYAIYVKSTTGAIYDSKYSGSWTNESATGWNTDATNKHLTSNYSDASRIYAEWTSGSSFAYTLNWNYIIIPEKVWFLLGLGLVIPWWIRRRRKRGKHAAKINF